MSKQQQNVFTVTVFLLTFVHFTIQTDLFEGSTCQLHTGEMGICKNAENCKWLIQNLQKKKMKFNDIRRCSFADLNGEIVCCGDEHPTKPVDPPKPVTPCELGSFNCEESTPPTPKPHSTPNKFNGSKAAAACERYSNVATPYSNWNIINGIPVGQGEYPHMVALGYRNRDSSEYDFDCGGTLIAEQWVVTAAHCIKDRRKPVMIRMGKLILYNDEDGLTAIDRPIKRIIRHPEYSNSRKKNDIALIEFDGTIDLNDLTRPACIRTDLADVPESKELIITGWGSIEADRTNRSEIMLKANVSTIPFQRCNQQLLEYNRLSNQPSLRNGLSESQMCALNSIEKRDACQGDSGGPLFLNDQQTGVSTVVGIVSFGISCGSELPGVYTRIASFVDWIENIVWP